MIIAAGKAGNLSWTRIDSSNSAKSESPERGKIGAGAVAHPKKKCRKVMNPNRQEQTSFQFGTFFIIQLLA
jgi:hypothetical protein